MKKTLLYLVAIILMVGCKGYEHSDLQLGGDCLVTKLVLNDSLIGAVDLQTRSIEVVTPEFYDLSAMTVTELQLSEGATCNIKSGDVINLLQPRTLNVQNGDVKLTWSLSARQEIAKITSFVVNGIYTGIINESAKTITIYLPVSVELTSLIPTIEISEGATISPAAGMVTDFSQPVVYEVDNHSAHATYTVTALQIDKPKALYVGLAGSMDQLNPEEYKACLWMLGNVEGTLYASFDDIKSGAIDISECKLMWWHYHRDGGCNGGEAFEQFAAPALNAITTIQSFLEGGGSLFLTRYATHLPAYLRINGEEATGRYPNNCWGGNEMSPEIASGAWSFFTDSVNHPIWQNLIMGADPKEIFCCDAGYHITNSTAQWHLGMDWGGYPDIAYFTKKTGAHEIGHGGDGAIVAWEWKRSAQNGGIVCIGSGCFDWYSDAEEYTGYHDNVNRIAQNAINYLMQ